MHFLLKHSIILFFLASVHITTATENFPDYGEIRFPKAETLTENTIRIPFQLVDHLIVVKAEVTGREGNFIIDTGAETLVLNSVHFKKYNRRKYRTTTGVNHTIDKTYMKKLDTFFLKGFAVNDIAADIIDLSHIEKSKKAEFFGIIGYKVLKDYEVFIDFYLKQITLSKTDKEGNRVDKHLLLEKITDSLSFRQKKHTIVLNAFINGEKVNFGLDSGAEINHLNNTVSKNILKKFVVLERIKVIGAGKRKKEAFAGKLYGVKLSNTIYNGVMRTILANLREMNNAYGTHLDGILGYEFLVNRRTIINYKKKKLYFIPYPNTKNE